MEDGQAGKQDIGIATAILLSFTTTSRHASKIHSHNRNK